MRVIALLKEARPPSSGIFSRCTMTTRLWDAVESVERQFHLAVQPTGIMIRASPARYLLISADGAPAFLVTTKSSDAVRPALSTCSQGNESAAARLESANAGDTGSEAAAAGGAAAACVREKHANKVAHSGNTVRTRKQREVDIIYLALVTCVIVNTCIASASNSLPPNPDSGLGLELNSEPRDIRVDELAAAYLSWRALPDPLHKMSPGRILFRHKRRTVKTVSKAPAGAQQVPVTAWDRPTGPRSFWLDYL